MNAILKRWKAKGGSSYDPLPTLAHHLVHILAGCLLGTVLQQLLPSEVAILVATAMTLMVIVAEILQVLGGASVSDSVFDVYQYQPHWAWYWGLDRGLIIFMVWTVGYFILLLTTLDENGNPR